MGADIEEEDDRGDLPSDRTEEKMQRGGDEKKAITQIKDLGI
jgi:hypothetical protein